MSDRRPVLAVTLGDPAGIGPEVVRKALQDKSLYNICRPLIVGNAQSFLNFGATHASTVHPILNPAQARYRPGVLDILHIPHESFRLIRAGAPGAASGAVSYLSVQKSVELALTRLADGIVHAPISKAAWKEAGVRFPGHTELIAELCGTKKFAMAIASGPLRTVMATRHIPLAKVAGSIRKDEILNCIDLAFGWMKRLDMRRPKVGVCALNPHAGESGLIGREEIDIIAPAVKAAQRKFCKERSRPLLTISGPIPADSAFKDLKAGRLDCLVTLYHDQSLIPAKLYDASRVINITLGLAFPRTSPGHGTAFDIAGKNRADPRPMIEAILTCAKLCR